ncbi:hypothetical protein SCOCK_60254 [Actinacidiphila cocklensis]|uniref:Uncharacterized protein n=1 Tax=Actinacidiphila cocklensis TaxID=887465 RepID=A0A9W4DYW3_9ACTN|nr:hypothetical protein SCOCK_60254 [Actinacidiphila cocklensis]
MADPAAVEDDAMRQHRPLRLREEPRDVLLDLLRVLGGGPAEAPGQPSEVGVHGDPRYAEGVAEDNVGRLAADAGQLDQVFEAAGDLAAEVVAQRRGQAEHRAGLGAEESRGPQDLLQRRRIGRRHRLRRRIQREQRRRRLVHPQVGGLRGQHGGDQQLEGILEVQLGVGVRIHLGQFAVDPPGLPHQSRMRLRDLRLLLDRGTAGRGPARRATTRRHAARLRAATDTRRRSVPPVSAAPSRRVFADSGIHPRGHPFSRHRHLTGRPIGPPEHGYGPGYDILVIDRTALRRHASWGHPSDADKERARGRRSAPCPAFRGARRRAGR